MTVDDSKLNQVAVLTLTTLSDVILLEQVNKVCDIWYAATDLVNEFCSDQKRGSEIVYVDMQKAIFIYSFTHGSVSLLLL